VDGGGVAVDDVRAQRVVRVQNQVNRVVVRHGVQILEGQAAPTDHPQVPVDNGHGRPGCFFEPDGAQNDFLRRHVFSSRLYKFFLYYIPNAVKSQSKIGIRSKYKEAAGRAAASMIRFTALVRYSAVLLCCVSATPDYEHARGR
jgi:hypothetical protein